ncbi:MAG TPA: hypothetical protein VHZ28_13925 [Terracidiphilus sp.]|jgi:hypothetical protein|nr:hypothetical protein [Terracidiphilus sp.]
MDDSTMNFTRSAHLLGATCMLLACTLPALGVSCKTQAAMTEAERAPIVQAARQIALDVQGGRAADLKAATVPAVAANFSSIEQSAAALTPLISRATITVDAVYKLDASDAKPGDEQQQFFCGSADSNLHATFSIQHLPPGQFAFALVHATGLSKPQQIALLLQSLNAGGPWQLAGFFPKPLSMAAHDGLWYWKQARTYAQKKQMWNAWFYYSTAVSLLQPAGFFSSANLEKLVDEQETARPADLPGTTPLTVKGEDTTYTVTSLRTDDALGGLDLVAHYNSTSSDPVANRTHTIAVMRGLLTLHPELREGFHGLWVFADAGPGGQAFSLEQPMSDLH